MKERPILMNGAMVRAVLDGSKTQTRRLMKPQPVPIPGEPGKHWWPSNAAQSMMRVEDGFQKHPGIFDDACPHGQPGDRIWVRETFADIGYRLTYRADEDDGAHCKVKRWIPSIHMPCADSRILLEIVSVRVERLQDISDADIVAEGIDMEALAESQDRYDIVCKGSGASGRATERSAWRDLWESTGGDWEANPWCWAITFKRVAP